MIVSIIENTTEKPFPKLMKSTITEIIVLFISKDKGTVLDVKKTGHSMGGFHEGFDISHFEDFNGKVTLSNG